MTKPMSKPLSMPLLKQKFQRRRLALAVSSVVLGSLSWQVGAQSDSGNELQTLEEVVVTATKRETDVMKTPVAVTAVTQDSLTQKGITNVSGIAQMVPNMQMGTSSTDSGVQASIRGVTSTNFTEIGDPSVSVHIDGYYSARPQGSLALMFDLEQVEALRGPQGTLFGRNSPGGTINIITAKADTSDSYGSVQAELGNYNKRLVQAVGNVAVSDTLAIRASMMGHKRDGYVEQSGDFLERHIPEQGLIADGIPDVDQRYARDVGAEDAYYNANEWGGRVSLHWAPVESVRWDLAYEHYTNDSAGSIQMQDCEMAEGTRFDCSQTKGGDQWSANINVPGVLEMDIDSLRSTLSFDVSDNTTIDWRLGYQITDRVQITDGDAGNHILDEQVDVSVPVAAWAEYGTWLHDSWSMWTPESTSKNLVTELQIQQEFDSVRYVAGVFHMDENSKTQSALDYEMHAPFGYPFFSYYDQPDRNVESSAVFAQGDFTFADDWTLTVGGRYSWDKKFDVGGRSYEGPWDGIAWTDEGRTGFYYNGEHTPIDGEIPHQGYDLTRNMGPEAGPAYLANYGIEPSINDYEKSWEKFTYRLGLQYDIDDDAMVFASLSTGYKAGGFGDRVDRCGGGTCVDGTTEQYTYLDYDPEEVTNLEFGYKGSLLEDRLNLGATFFFMDYSDMQFTGSHAIGQQQSDCDWGVGCELTQAWKTENIGRSEIYGLEFEYDYIPWQNGRLNGYFSWLHTEVKEYNTYDESTWMCGSREEFGAEACVEPYAGDELELRGRRLYDVTGNQLPMSPEFSLSVNYSHSFNFDSGYSLVPWVSVRWQDDMYFTVRNLDNANIGDYQEAYTSVDANLRFSAPDAQWYVEAYGSNLTDNSVKSWMGNDQSDYVLASYNPPRQYGLRMKYNF